MFSVRYEKYLNDSNHESCTKQFDSLNDIEDWMFSMMCRNYKEDDSAMRFPQGSQPSRICLRPESGGANIWIHLIFSDDGIVFSDGQYTSGQKHASKSVQKWLSHCKERRDNSTFNFVE